MKRVEAESFVSSDPKLTALAVAMGGHLTRINALPSGRLEFVVDGVPSDLAEQVLNDAVTVSGRRFIAAMDGILAIIAQRRRGR